MAKTFSEDAPGIGEDTNPAPVIVDLGRQKAKAVKQLRNGKGKLIDDVFETINQLRSAGTISASAQPVIVVVREKREDNSLLSLLKV